jgi:hypothetical protein
VSGVTSPLLANIALCAIEERYERHAWPRHVPTLLTDPAAITKRGQKARKYDRPRGCFFMPVRYADDFIIFASAPPGPSQQEEAETAANAEKVALAAALKNEWTLELSEAKTLVTPVTKTLRFLGHHIRVRAHPTHGRLASAVVIPKDRSHRLRERIKDILARSTIQSSLADRLRLLNPILRGWCNFYRYAWGAKHVFYGLDHYVWWTILRWLRKKHPTTTMKVLCRRYGWRKSGRGALRWGDGDVRPFQLGGTPVHRFKLGWLKPPAFAIAEGEPGA